MKRHLSRSDKPVKTLCGRPSGFVMGPHSKDYEGLSLKSLCKTCAALAEKVEA